MTMNRREFLAGAAVIAGAAAFSCSRHSHTAGQGEPLVVGGLPVTCNLTLPIACVARGLSLKNGTSKGMPFEYQKFSGWPEVKESLMSGRIQAAYMLAPLVMDLTDKKIPIKIVSLGHRSGAVIMVRTDSGYRTFQQLKGKRIAIPSRFAVDFLFLRKMLSKEGMSPTDVQLVEMAPPDMPAALYAKAVDAYCTGEPFGAAAQKAGYAVPLKMTRDEWPKYMCCVLTVREELIKSQRRAVQDLVDFVDGAGLWLDQKHEHRNRAVQIAAGRKYFNQDPSILQYVMDNPTDRVTYGDLRMIRSEFDEMMQLSLEAGTLKHPIAYEQYVDDSFARNSKPISVDV
jgi:NitT/TauT family transport system substrate-binding protein